MNECLHRAIRPDLPDLMRAIKESLPVLMQLVFERHTSINIWPLHDKSKPKDLAALHESWSCAVLTALENYVRQGEPINRFYLLQKRMNKVELAQAVDVLSAAYLRRKYWLSRAIYDIVICELREKAGTDTSVSAEYAALRTAAKRRMMEELETLPDFNFPMDSFLP